MGEHGAHPNAFVRSFSARGELGGLSRAARAAVDAFDAAGFDRVIVETVGTGQSETRIAALADTGSSSARPGSATTSRRSRPARSRSPTCSPSARATCRSPSRRRGRCARCYAAPQPRRRRLEAARRRRPRPCQDGIDGLLEALDAHALSASAGAAPARRRGGAARARPRSGGDRPATPRLAPAWLAHDGLCAALGITLLAGGPGRSEVAMTVEARHLNFNGGCHGGAIFSLADSAFGLASNSHGPLASGIAAHITYQAGVRAGERLVARAIEVSRSRRIAVYRIDVVRPDPDGSETAVSSFTGTVSSRPEPARAEGYTGGCCPVDCRQNDNLASKFS